MVSILEQRITKAWLNENLNEGIMVKRIGGSTSRFATRRSLEETMSPIANSPKPSSLLVAA
jgi:hypothetical protein